jgi:sugar lactone lactonase YvrE
MRRVLLVVFALMSFGVPASAQPDAPALPDPIVFEAPAGLQPEGIVWDAERERFIVGSLLDGTVGTVTDDGVYTPLFTDPLFEATTGLHIADGRLYVANTSPSAFIPFARGLASLVVYDLSLDAVVLAVNLTDVHAGGGARFANDVTVDTDGTAYLTDSFQPVLYAVTPEGEASVLVESPLLDAPFLGSNGIDIHPDGFLLVGVSGTESLVRVPLDDPTALALVAWDVPAAIDGMVLAEDGTTLYAVTRREVDGQTVQAVSVYVSADGWQTATLSASFQTGGEATTLTVRDGDVYVIDAHLQDFFRTEYPITRAVFE